MLVKAHVIILTMLIYARNHVGNAKMQEQKPLAKTRRGNADIMLALVTVIIVIMGIIARNLAEDVKKSQ